MTTYYPRWFSVTLSIAFGVVGFALLQGAVGMGLISAYVVPPPIEMLLAVPTLFREEELLLKFFLTFGTTFAATLLSIIIGVPFGWFLYRKPAFAQAYESWLGAAFAAPLILLYPLFMVVFGRGIPTILAMGVVAGIVPITLSTLQGLRGVPKVYLNVARTLRMTEFQIGVTTRKC